MALPKQSLSAHDRRPLLSGNVQQLLHALPELIGEHLGDDAPEGVADDGVPRLMNSR
jgi:hypothetical protein